MTSSHSSTLYNHNLAGDNREPRKEEIRENTYSFCVLYGMLFLLSISKAKGISFATLRLLKLRLRALVGLYQYSILSKQLRRSRMYTLVSFIRGVRVCDPFILGANAPIQREIVRNQPRLHIKITSSCPLMTGNVRGPESRHGSCHLVSSGHLVKINVRYGFEMFSNATYSTTPSLRFNVRYCYQHMP